MGGSETDCLDLEALLTEGISMNSIDSSAMPGHTAVVRQPVRWINNGRLVDKSGDLFIPQATFIVDLHTGVFVRNNLNLNADSVISPYNHMIRFVLIFAPCGQLKLWLSQPNYPISNNVFIANPGCWYASPDS